MSGDTDPFFTVAFVQFSRTGPSNVRDALSKVAPNGECRPECLVLDIPPHFWKNVKPHHWEDVTRELELAGYCGALFPRDGDGSLHVLIDGRRDGTIVNPDGMFTLEGEVRVVPIRASAMSVFLVVVPVLSGSTAQNIAALARSGMKEPATIVVMYESCEGSSLAQLERAGFVRDPELSGVGPGIAAAPPGGKVAVVSASHVRHGDDGLPPRALTASIEIKPL